MRALLAEPEAPLRAQIRGVVFDHLRQRGIPGLMVTHDASDAVAAGGVVVQL